MKLKDLLKKKDLRVLVFGGRDYSDKARLAKVLSVFGDDVIIIHGAARGADSLAEQYAKSREWATISFPAQWKKFGNSAGPIRNARMLKIGRPDIAIGFPGGSGTKDMYTRCKTAGVKVRRVDW